MYEVILKQFEPCLEEIKLACHPERSTLGAPQATQSTVG